MSCLHKILNRGDIMTRTERSDLEKELFLQTNLNPALHKCIENIYYEYKLISIRYPSMHEAKFGMLYCKMILSNKRNKKPNYKKIMNYTKETQTTYYTYRRTVLEYIGKKIKEQNGTLD